MQEKINLNISKAEMSFFDGLDKLESLPFITVKLVLAVEKADLRESIQAAEEGREKEKPFSRKKAKKLLGIIL